MIIYIVTAWLCLLGGTFVYNKNFVDHFATVYAKYTHYLSQYAGSTWGASSFVLSDDTEWLYRTVFLYCNLPVLLVLVKYLA